MLEAGSMVADSAVTAAQNIHEKASRFGLDIEIVAPQVYVPQSSSSRNCLIADLGHVKLDNRFIVLVVKSASGSSAVLDNMTVNLTELKLSRYLIINRITLYYVVAYEIIFCHIISNYVIYQSLSF